jgi:hypothetical protein
MHGGETAVVVIPAIFVHAKKLRGVDRLARPPYHLDLDQDKRNA